VSLSERGIEQAQSLLRQCAGTLFDAVFCSDLKRAVETAKLVFPDCRLVLDSRLREMNYGVLNGRPGREFPSDELECIHTRYTSGENCLDVEERVREFLEERASDFRDGNIAVVSHKYPQLALEVICNNTTWEEAILNDWRKVGYWRPGWRYTVHA
jgi:alpha-ribazole phosphatase/probable phosphoglycerate mutase